MLVAWWEVLRWLRDQPAQPVDEEWTALTITLMIMIVGFIESPTPQLTSKVSKRSTRSSRSSIGSNHKLDSWRDMFIQVTGNGSTDPYWTRTPGWDWCMDDETRETEALPTNALQIGYDFEDLGNPTPKGSDLALPLNKKNASLIENLRLAREFLASPAGVLAMGVRGYLPTAQGRDPEIQRTAVPTILVGLHLYREEQKLNMASSDSVSTGAGKLTPILAQLGHWLGWDSWSWKDPEYYSTEDARMSSWHFDDGTGAAPSLTLG